MEGVCVSVLQATGGEGGGVMEGGGGGGGGSGAGDMERNEGRRQWIDGGKEEGPRCRK